MTLSRARRGAAVLAVLAAAAAAAVFPTGAAAQAPAATVVPIQVTGPPATRFNLVILGDGYTAAEQQLFRDHVDKHVNVMWSIEPYKSYRSYMNVYRVEIVSPESGVDCDPDLTSPRRNTPLGMGFWGGCNASSVQRLLTVSSSAASQYANLVAGTSSSNRQILAIGNSNTYGGAGGTNATASGGNALSALISPHEIGHSLGGLQDEYDYFARGVRGGAYTGGEPSSIHHTLLTEQQLLDQQRKWWRWLGEPSEAGGVIGRYEGGQQLSTGIWRPSKHSIMKTLGYAYDQPERERMTQRISARTSLIPASTPSTAPIGADRVVWIETAHPVSHELSVTWTLDGAALPATGQDLDLAALGLAPGTHTLTATVVDPTEFVRDPAIRGSSSLTQTRTWLVDTALTTAPATVAPAFASSTGTDRPVGADDVVHAETSHPASRALRVAWALDGEPVATPGNDRDLDLAPLRLRQGAHTLTATVSDPGDAGAGTQTLAWSVDADDPVARFELSKALFKPAKPTHPRTFVYNGAFTMELTATDDRPGYVVREFRTDGDGWFNYFGWPTDSEAPWLFTPSGTNIDDLIYGKLGVPRLSPWDDPTPSYGRHTIEYRAIDAAGNVAGASEFAVVLLPEPPACTTTISRYRSGGLTVASGVTCIEGVNVAGPVAVEPGAALVVRDGKIDGTLTTSGAAAVHLLSSTVTGAVSLAGTAGDAILLGSRFVGSVSIDGTAAPRPPVVAGNTLLGPLDCSGNVPAPVNDGVPNTLHAAATGQCTGL